MSFVRKKITAYPWPVEVKKPSETTPGEFETSTFIIKFKRLKKSELVKFEADQDYAALKKIIVGWSQIQDEDGKDIVFSDKELKAFSEDVDWVAGVVTAFTDFYQNAQGKN
tara:strand:+ start:148 stop:480 length:333 start_codon:yes stop_codon:yes gene_type:complete